MRRPPPPVFAALAVCSCTAAAFAPPMTFAMASSTSPETPRSTRYGRTRPAPPQQSAITVAAVSAGLTYPRGVGASPTSDLRSRALTSENDVGVSSSHRLRSRKSTALSSASSPGRADEKDPEAAPEQLVRGGATGRSAPVVQQPKKTPAARVAFYLAVWYSFTIGYNVYNKATLNRISAPWTLSTVQLAIGSLYVCGIWLSGIRKAPKLNGQNIRAVVPLAVLHTTAHIAAVVALSVGALGYFQIVKAGEPLFTALFNALLLGEVFAWPVYATLLPVVGGVAVASMKELSFNWITFGGAMTANMSGAARGVLAKGSMDMPKGENMDAGNLYGVMTIMATLMITPFALVVEGPKFRGLWAAAMAAGHTKYSIVKGTILSSLFFYMYNEVAFYCLNAIHPVTHAVANTLKRVFLIAASIIVFGHQLTPVGGAGSVVAIVGVLLYSLAKQKYARTKE